ncbi:unnamed protein product, partial [Laminaria digitata]
MFIPMSQGNYGYIPQMSHLQGGLPVYQMAGGGIDGGQVGSRPNGVAGGDGGGGGAGAGVSTAGVAGGSGGHGSPGSPSMNSPQSAASPGAGQQHPQQLAPPQGPQGFQVHYALTPQGIVPMVPMMPNGAGGFTNPALYPSLAGVYDDGRAGMGAMPAIATGIDGGGGAGMEKGRLSPPLATVPSMPSMHPRFTGSPPQPSLAQQSQGQQHPGALQPMHAPAW